jgi:predicted RNA-binding Zn-ribbon protein involved in translation (DUF1610 family)
MEETARKKNITMTCTKCESTDIKIERTGYKTNTDFICSKCGIKEPRSRLWQ